MKPPHITTDINSTWLKDQCDFDLLNEQDHRLINRIRSQLSQLNPNFLQHGLASLPLVSSRWEDRSDTGSITTQDLLDGLAFTKSLAGDDVVAQNAVALTFLHGIGDIFHTESQIQGNSGYLDMAIECYTQAVPLIPDNHVEKPSMLMTTSLLYRKRFEAKGVLSDLWDAFELMKQTVSCASDEHPMKPTYLSYLSILCLDLFGKLSQLSELCLALDCCIKALSLTSDNDPKKPGILDQLGLTYCAKFRQSGKLLDLETAINHQTQAVMLVSDEHPDASWYLGNLGNLHITRYEQLGHPADLSMGIQCQYRALSLTLDNDLNKPSRLNNLGAALVYQYLHSGQLSDLDMAVECHERAVALTPINEVAGLMYLKNLGFTYLYRYKHLGQLADIDASITCRLQAVDLVSNRHPDLPFYLASLGVSYQNRFQRLNQLSDINTAISYFLDAISLTPEDHPAHPGHLNDLGNAYLIRYQHTGQLEDLKIALLSHNQALLSTPNEDFNRPGRLSNISNAYYHYFTRSGQIMDLNLAIEYCNQAVSLLPESHTDRPKHLGNLSHRYYTRYQTLDNLVDLDLAIDCERNAAFRTPDSRMDKPKLLANLGRSLTARFHRSHDVADVLESIACFKQAACSPVGDPQTREQSAYQWAKLSVAHCPQSALEAFEYYMSLLSQVVWLGMAAKVRYEQVPRIAARALEAATVAMRFEAHALALEWIEQGRSIVWNQLRQLHSPLDILQEVDPLLANELSDVARQLQNAASLGSSVAGMDVARGPLEQSAQSHRRLVEHWERLVGRAQSLPGMSEFLAPKKAAKLVESAHAGAVVVVIVHQEGCGALTISAGTSCIERVLLPRLSHKQLADSCKQLNFQPQQHARMERKFVKALKPELPGRCRAVLAMLWSDLVKPILDSLGCTEVLPLDQLPRITWCTTGPLSFLPLHAAGDYSKPKSSLFDYAISSYTPTISTLLAPLSEPTAFSGIALVGQENTPGLPLLPGTRNELDAIENRTKHLHTVRVEGYNAKHDSVLGVMQESSWIHLACHASQDLGNPTDSAFHLHDGPLDLSTITRKPLGHADLAFLSACQTATGDKDLSEEAVHLAAGMIMAGYRTVIATMWPVEDQDAPVVADRFYEYILKDGVPDSRNAARALHYAVGYLREQVGVEAYMRWAPFVHIGN